MKLYIGWDWRDDMAFRVNVASLRKHASIPVRIEKISDYALRKKGVFWRESLVDRDGQMWDAKDGKPYSTMFSFARFAVPLLEKDGWAGFMDADMLWRADIAELVSFLDDDKALMCVQHAHYPNEKIKMDGVRQTAYRRKNWSSLMFFNCNRNQHLTPFVLNNWTGSQLHALQWLQDDEIGALPGGWNHLVGYDDEHADPKVCHFTLGTPDMEHAVPSKWNDEWLDYAKTSEAAA